MDKDFVTHWNKNILIALFIIILILTISGCGGGGSSMSLIPSSTGSKILAWDPPTTNADNTPLTDLAGYKVYYGQGHNNYTQSIDVGNNTSIPINNLATSSSCFAVTAYDLSGNESDYSNEVCL